MKRFLKFVGYAVALVVGLAVSNWWFSWAGELVSTKNSFAVATGLLMFGVALGAWGWVAFTVAKAGWRAANDWMLNEHEEFMLKSPLGKPAKKGGDCCQNDCGCDRSR